MVEDAGEGRGDFRSLAQVDESEEVAKKLIRNTLYNALGRFCSYLVNFVLVPYILYRIGVVRYGVWSIVGVVTSYVGLIDLGVGSSYVKFISEYCAKKDYGGLNKTVATGFVFYALFAAAAIAALFPSAGRIVAFFKIPPELHEESVFVLRMGLGIFLASNAFVIFWAIPRGLQRMDIPNKVRIAMSFPQAAGTIYFLEAGYGLPGLMVNNAILFCVNTAINIIIAYRLLPQLHFNPLLASAGAFKRLIGLGLNIQGINMANVVGRNIDKFLLGALLNMESVTFYALGSRVALAAQEIPALLYSAVVPAASELDALQRKELLKSLYERGSKYTALLVFPLMGLLVVIAPYLMAAWLGDGFHRSVRVLQVVAPAYMGLVLLAIPTTISVGTNRVRFVTLITFAQTALNIALSAFLLLTLGFIGAALGTSIAAFYAMAHTLCLFHLKFGYSMRDTLADIYLQPLLAAVFASLSVAALNLAMGVFWQRPGRMGSFGLAALDCAVFAAIYVGLLVSKNYIDSYDRRLLKSYIPGRGS